MTLRFRCSAAAFALAFAAATAPAKADEAAIGMAAPTSGPSSILGAQVVAGVRQALAGQRDFTLVETDTACSAEGGRAAGERFVREKVRVVVGFLCTEALDAALPALSAAGIPTIVVGVRADRFTDGRAKSKLLVWRVAPRSDASAKAIAALVVGRWGDGPFGLVDDGSVDGRALSDAVRSAVETAGLKPAFLDTYRPAEEKQFGLVRRIAASGVTRLVIAGDRPDVAVIVRDASANGLALEIVGGEALFDEPGGVPLAAGVLAVALRWQFDEVADPLPAGEAPESREGYFGPALAATAVAVGALRQAAENGRPLPEILDGSSFPTPLGPVRFDGKGDADLGLFQVFRFDGADFVPQAGG